MIQVQRVIERDEELGAPESQAALEVINAFNVDMAQIHSNLDQMATLLYQSASRNKAEQHAIQKTEEMVISIVQRQAELESNVATLAAMY